MPLTVNQAKASFTVSGPEYEPTGAEALRTEDDRRYWWKIFGEWCLRAKRKELAKGQDRRGKPFKPIKYVRPDGATGPPLSPHRRASRFQKWARVVATTRQVTLFWSHGWAKVVGAHAFPKVRPAGWKLPKRDAVGLTPGSLRWAFGMTLGAWRHKIGTGPAKLTHVTPPVGSPPIPLEVPTLRPRPRTRTRAVPKSRVPTPKVSKPGPAPSARPSTVVTPVPDPVAAPVSGTAILPGRPIAERLAAYTAGDRIAAALSAHHRAFDEAESARKAFSKELLEWERKSFRGKLSPADQKEMNAVGKRYEDAKARAVKLQETERQVLLDHLTVAEPLKVTIAPQAVLGTQHGDLERPTAELSQNLASAADWLGKIMARGDLGSPTLEVPAGMIPASRAPRPYYSNSDRAIALSAKERVAVIVHEFGHGLDDRLELLERSREFLAHRVGDEAARPLQEVLPHAKYAAWEQGRKDKFDEAFGAQAWYVGKDYGAERYAEVLPMGLQKLYENPAEFAARDPEYFKWVVGIVTGALR